MFIQNSYRFGGAVESLLLDTYTGAAAAYSLRKLRTGVTNVVRVRRSNDNAEQNFTPIEITDGTLTTFTGSNDGFITIWYDQSGNSVNAVQSTAGNQPRLVLTGVLNTDNGKPFIYYDGTNFKLTASSTGLSNSVGTFFTTYNSNDTGNGMLMGSSSGNYAGVMQNGNLNDPNQNVGAPSYYKNGNLITPTRDVLFDNYVVNQDVLVSSFELNFSNNNNTWGTSLEPFVYTSNSFSAICKAKEFIVYNNDQTLNKAGIESNINAYYSIY